MLMVRPLSIAFLLCVFCLNVFSQKTKTVEAEYTYYGSLNETVEQAKEKAVERAKNKAIAEEFGTIVSQYNSTWIVNDGKSSNVDFNSIGSSDVKGDWIEDIDEPEFKKIELADNMIIVTVKVKGKAREIINAAIDFKAILLRNGTEDKFESDRFRQGDDLYLSFQSPVKGFLAVYLIDSDRRATCLLPYPTQEEGAYPIKANEKYIFFNIDKAANDEKDIVEEYTMTCERSMELNQIYVIFSPVPFTKANDELIDDMRCLDYKSFDKWLVKQRKHDVKMNLRSIPITITKEKEY